ncbi:hypothetical protein [Klenkia terrae]|uniref:Uncharacterized protein n=1 Tax=Klenkia terrae TaxID=1052259 RepID=A0ABU8E6D4_9ACTN|nr:hypothetical protein [Klenkia terrae]
MTDHHPTHPRTPGPTEDRGTPPFRWPHRRRTVPRRSGPAL